MSSRLRVVSASGAVALVAALAACSSSSTHGSASASSSPSSSSSAGSQPGSGAPIKVGLICACSGAVGPYVQPYSDGYQAWVKSVNASGGINGHPIQLILKDDGSNPATSLADAKALLADNVVAIADGTVLEQSWASVVQAANVPVVGYDQSSLDFGQNPDFYSPGQTADATIPSIVATAKTAGASALGALYCAEAPQCSELVPPLRSAVQQAGMTLPVASSISVTAPNFSSECLAAQQAHVNGLAVFDNNQTVVRVTADCVRQNYNPTYLIEGQGFAPDYLTSPGIKDNMWAEMPDLPYTSNTPAIQAMNAAVDKYYPGLRQSASNWDEGDAIAWDAGVLLEHAIKAGGLGPSDTPTAAEIVKGLTSLNGDTLDGLAPPLTFTAGQAHKVDCWFTVHVSNGTATLANNGQPTCQNGSSS